MKINKKQKQMILKIIAFLIIALGGGSYLTNFLGIKDEVTLSKCVDGDTAYFYLKGNSTKFRFLAVDTPESVHPTKEVEAYGKTASDYTCELLTNAKKIVIEYDSNSNKEDKYGRKLAWIWVDGELLEKKLIEIGYAEVAYIYDDYKYINELCEAQQEAIAKKYGIWSDETRKEGYCKTIK